MDLDKTWQVGLRPEKTKPCTFPAKSRYGFQRERAKKWVAEASFFLWREPRTTSATFLGSISAKLPTNTCPGMARDTWFHIPEKFPLMDRICRKPVFLGHPVCAQPTGHGKRFATPTLFPSPNGLHTDDPFLGDFCWGMYRFPPIHLRKWPFAAVSATGIPGWEHSSATWREAGHYSIGL